MIRLLVFILAITLVVPAFGQRKKKEDGTATPVFSEGITYALPRTGVRIYVKTVKETFEPGPYATYADQLLGVTDAKTSAGVKWAINEVVIETFAEPDPDQVHKALGDASFLLSLAPDGCLAGINSSVAVQETKPVKTNRLISVPEKNDGFSFQNINDSPLYTTGDSTNNFRPVRIGADQKAAQAAARVLQCRMTQFDMAAGRMDEFHPDGTAYKVSLDELKEIEKEYLSLFTGRTTYREEMFSFDFVPGASSEKGDVIFRFSDENGVVPASDLSGKPVAVKVEPEKNLAGKYSGLAKSDNPVAGESGVYYRMPGIATISVVYELKTIASARAVVAQLGAVAPVPEELLYGEYAVEIHPETGAIKSVSKK
jgi:hypothetical protein